MNGAEFKAQKTTPTRFPSHPSATMDTSHADTGSDDITSCESDWPVYIVLTTGSVFGCDLVVSATGVAPSSKVVEMEGGAELVLAEDGGVAVDGEMRTNLCDVYAAGDVCTVQWDNHSKLWFQVNYI